MSENSVSLNFNNAKVTINAEANANITDEQKEKLNNLDWKTIYDNCEADSNGGVSAADVAKQIKEHLGMDSYIALDNVMFAASCYDDYFENYDDLINLSDDEKDLLVDECYEVEEFNKNSETKLDKTEKEKLGFVGQSSSKIKKDNEGKYFIELDKYSQTRSDNLDCISRIIYNIYGVSLYSDEGLKIYEEIAKLNDFDKDFNKVKLMENQKVILSSNTSTASTSTASQQETINKEYEKFYNSDGKLSSWVFYNEDGSIKQKNYYNEDEKIEKTGYYDDEGVEYMTTYYDENLRENQTVSNYYDEVGKYTLKTTEAADGLAFIDGDFEYNKVHQYYNENNELYDMYYFGLDGHIYRKNENGEFILSEGNG